MLSREGIGRQGVGSREGYSLEAGGVLCIILGVQLHLSVLGNKRDDEEHLLLPRHVAPITLCFLLSWFSIFNYGFHSLSSLVNPEDFIKERAFKSHKVTFMIDPSQVVLVVKNLPANAGDIRDSGSIPRLGRSPRGGYGNLLQ